METRSFSEADNCSHSVPFMKPEGTLLNSQEPTNGPFSKPDESGPHPHTIFI